MMPRTVAVTFLAVAMLTSALAQNRDSSDCTATHPTQDAWWTGPMLANTAETAPRGHYLLEPYFYDVSTQGSFAANGARHSAPHANSYGSLTYIVYGLTDTWGVGVIPTGGYSLTGRDSGAGMGDLTLQVQHRLTHFVPCRRIPTLSIAVQETLPTGRYDRLGDRTARALGAGAYTTNIALYSQMYFWLPNRRIVRMRINLSEAISSDARVKDTSVYGTAEGFRGNAQPGASLFLDTAWEYSLTRRWVLALDATYRHTTDTRVSGYSIEAPDQQIVANSGPSDAFGLAPAVEYNFNSHLGVLLGTRIIPAGRNATATITPAVAINFVH